MVVAAIYSPEKTLDGYMQPGAYMKWRELSAVVELPRRLFSRAGARNASLVFSARNLHTWTDYSGVDPEVNGLGQSDPFLIGARNDFFVRDFLTQPPVRYWLARVNLGF